VNFAVICVVIAAVSILGSLLFVKRHSAQPRQVKAVFFGFYFWGLIFLQLIILSLAYWLVNQ
jgi:hypothetical protein